MRVSELKRLADLKKNEKISIFNPLLKYFSVRFNGRSLIVGAGSIKEFSYYQGMHVAKHLTDRLMNERHGDLPIDHQPERSDILKEVVCEENN